MRTSRTIREAIAAAAALIALAACDGRDPCAGDCSTLTVVATAEPDALLPHITAQDVSTAIILQLFSRLARPGEEFSTLDPSTLEPELARSWEQTDPTTLTFHLRSDSRWHDGEPVTAADVVFSFDLYRDPSSGSRFVDRLARISAVEAADDSTVVVRFTESYAEQVYEASYFVFILPRHLLAEVPAESIPFERLAREPVGSGPYRYRDHEPGSFVRLERAEDHAGPGTIIFRVIPDPDAASLAIRTGSVDLHPTITGRGSVEELTEVAGLRLQQYPTPVYAFVAFNFRNPVLMDRRVRMALNHASDMRAAVEAVFGPTAEPAVGPFSRVSPLWTSSLARFSHDPARADSLLSGAGWLDRDGDGVRENPEGAPMALRLLVPSSSQPRLDIAAILQQQWRQVGVRLDIQSLEFNAFMDRAAAGDFDAVFSAFLTEMSPAGIADLWSSTGIGENNWGAYSNPEFDAALAGARSAEPGAALDAWREAIAILIADAPAVWAFEPVVYAAIDTGWSVTPIPAYHWAGDLRAWR